MNDKLDEFINAACNWYCRNKTWKSRYEGLSERVKEYMGYSFAHGYGSLVEEAKADYNALREEISRRVVAFYKSFTAAEWVEAIALCGNERGLKMARAYHRVKYEAKSDCENQR